MRSHRSIQHKCKSLKHVCARYNPAVSRGPAQYRGRKVARYSREMGRQRQLPWYYSTVITNSLVKMFYIVYLQTGICPLRLQTELYPRTLQRSSRFNPPSFLTGPLASLHMPTSLTVNSDVPELQASIYSERRAQRVFGAVAVSPSRLKHKSAQERTPCGGVIIKMHVVSFRGRSESKANI